MNDIYESPPPAPVPLSTAIWPLFCRLRSALVGRLEPHAQARNQRLDRGGEHSATGPIETAAAGGVATVGLPWQKIREAFYLTICPHLLFVRATPRRNEETEKPIDSSR